MSERKLTPFKGEKKTKEKFYKEKKICSIILPLKCLSD
jgi:hypothetical protein